MAESSSILDNYAAFESAVRDNFTFLEDNYGFRLNRNERIGYAKIIRYESPVVYVNLVYGPPDYEPAIAFGRIGIDDQPDAYSFSQGDLVQLESCVDWRWESDYPNHILGLVSEFARLLKECGVGCLKGRQAVFEEMKARRHTAMEAWRQEERANRIRSHAQVAWHKKDYAAVAKLYESIVDALGEVEKKKLDYAKRKIL